MGTLKTNNLASSSGGILNVNSPLSTGNSSFNQQLTTDNLTVGGTLTLTNGATFGDAITQQTTPLENQHLANKAYVDNLYYNLKGRLIDYTVYTNRTKDNWCTILTPADSPKNVGSLPPLTAPISFSSVLNFDTLLYPTNMRK